MWFYCRGLGCSFVVKSGEELQEHQAGCRSFLEKKRDRWRPPQEAVYCENWD
ncbi:MAG: hypothetical protein Hyperionvirus5_89 [Hyperionvirus sp.]|uniref:Uncharacterized protein n=1 Tax=Hyperionvirus sp. TaxID=2487770 RepID=A0A3G5ABN4_9VIRU|nr:MAG: hypothetical protein Hyperionvirus5_89 [Hyperionvirus sp.]